jgi:thiol-disulfide isomerase/thioredoxin
MRKIKNRDVNFLLNAVILTLIIMAVLHTIAPMVSPPDTKGPQVDAFTKELVPVRPMEMEKKLHNAEGKPSMLIVYASWCGYCRKLVPEVVSLIKDKKIDGKQVFLLSVDKEPADLSNYIVRNEYSGVFTPYIIQEGTSHELAGVLSVTGGSYKGGIPYIGFFNSDGKLVAETTGMVDKERLLADYNKAKAKP